MLPPIMESCSVLASSSRWLLAALVSIGTVAATSGSAQSNAAIAAAEVRAVRLDGAAVRIDGDASEAVWQQAELVTGLTSFAPVEGQPPAGQLVARVFYDEHALYISALITTEPGQRRGRLAARERWSNDDYFEVMLDPFLDRRTGYNFSVNPYGVQLDSTVVDGDASTAWDGVWDSAAKRRDDGYSVELRIPFRTLRFARAPVQDWGIGFGLFTGARKQHDKWPAMSADRGTVFAQLATLRGLQSVTPSSNLDIIPTVVTGYGGADRGQGFSWDDAVLARARQPGIVDPGLDVRYGLTSSSNLNLTINPDFSQIEADVEQLEYNLRFPIFFEEKRPFFLEGISHFDSPFSFLYTRSIVDPIAGLKLSGREGAVSFGLLSAWDQLPLDSQLAEAGTPSGFEDLSGKDAIDTIGRVAYELGSGSRVGVFAADKSLRDRASGDFDGRNDVFVGDALFTPSDIYLLIAQVAGSYTQGAGAAPDYGGLFVGGVARRRDSQLSLEVIGQYLSDGLRAETSQLSRVGVLNTLGSASYRYYTGCDGVPFVEPGVSVNTVNDDDSLELLDYAVRSSVVTRLGWNADLTAYYQRGQETFGERFRGIDLVGVTGEAYPWNWLAFKVDAKAGDQINYDPMDSFLGRTAQIAASAVIRPTDYAEIEARYTKSALWRPGGERIANVDLYYAKVSASFSTRLALRLISQLDTFDDTLRSSALLSYLVYPGTEAYLGYQEGDVVSGDARALDRRIFFKASYRWQP